MVVQEYFYRILFEGADVTPVIVGQRVMLVKPARRPPAPTQTDLIFLDAMA